MFLKKASRENDDDGHRKKSKTAAKDEARNSKKRVKTRFGFLSFWFGLEAVYGGFRDAFGQFGTQYPREAAHSHVLQGVDENRELKRSPF